MRRFLGTSISPAFEIGMPDAKERAEILKVTLRGERVEDNVDFDHLASLSEGYTGSDLFDLCKQAAYLPIRELLDDEKNGNPFHAPRPLSQQDLEKVLATSRKTRTAAQDYSRMSTRQASWLRVENGDDHRVQNAINELSKLVVSQILNLQPEPQEQ